MAQFAGTTATSHHQEARAADWIVVKPDGDDGASEPCMVIGECDTKEETKDDEACAPPPPPPDGDHPSEPCMVVGGYEHGTKEETKDGEARAPPHAASRPHRPITPPTHPPHPHPTHPLPPAPWPALMRRSRLARDGHWMPLPAAMDFSPSDHVADCDSSVPCRLPQGATQPGPKGRLPVAFAAFRYDVRQFGRCAWRSGCACGASAGGGKLAERQTG